MVDTLREVSPGCTEAVVFASGALLEDETEKRGPLPEGPDDWRWRPIKLERWCWTKFETCSKLWQRAWSGFSYMLPEEWDGITWEKKKKKQQSHTISKDHQNKIKYIWNTCKGFKLWFTTATGCNLQYCSLVVSETTSQPQLWPHQAAFSHNHMQLKCNCDCEHNLKPRMKLTNIWTHPITLNHPQILAARNSLLTMNQERETEGTWKSPRKTKMG